jgi:hypothetical protein
MCTASISTKKYTGHPLTNSGADHVLPAFNLSALIKTLKVSRGASPSPPVKLIYGTFWTGYTLSHMKPAGNAESL